jgi:hypothetical protein
VCDGHDLTQNYGGNPNNSKLTGGYVVKIGSEVVSQSSKLQPLVALPTTKAEHIAAVEAGKKILWMHQFMGELGYDVSEPSLLQINNQSAIAVSKNLEHLVLDQECNLRGPDCTCLCANTKHNYKYLLKGIRPPQGLEMCRYAWFDFYLEIWTVALTYCIRVLLYINDSLQYLQPYCVRVMLQRLFSCLELLSQVHFPAAGWKKALSLISSSAVFLVLYDSRALLYML